MPIDNELNPVLGIDLGTTFSAIARWDGRGARTYQILAENANTLQSVVYCDPVTKEILLGRLAYRRGLIAPENMVLGVKRMMDNATRKIVIGGQEFDPIQLSAKILSRLYGEIEEQNANKLKSRGTVVTVPYYFKTHQCVNTKKAAEQANINFLAILAEPIAAALSYAWQIVQQNPEREGAENILVFDLGGGTFDLTVFRLQQTQEKLIFKVLGTEGDNRLGGMDFDQLLVQLLLEKGGLTLNGLSSSEEIKAHQKLLEAAIRTKETLSATIKDYVSIPDVIPGQHIDTEVTRADFESLIQPYVDKIEVIIERLELKAKLKLSEIDRVILVGGSSKIPRMRNLLIDKIGTDKIYANTNPSLCVAEGAALYAAYLDDRRVFGREFDFQTRTSHALGVADDRRKFQVIVPANSNTDRKFRRLFTNTDDMTSVDIEVYQGSSNMAQDNTLIATIPIPDIPKRPRGQVEIGITFQVNEEQVLSVFVDVDGRPKGFVTINFT